MAEPIPRLSAIADALKNAPATNQDKQKLVQSFAYHFRAEIDAAGRDYATLTNDEAALFTVGKLKQFCRDIMRAASADVAAARDAVAVAEAEAEAAANNALPPEDTGIGAPMSGQLTR